MKMPMYANLVGSALLTASLLAHTDTAKDQTYFQAQWNEANYQEDVAGDLDGALAAYQDIYSNAVDDHRELAARSLVRIAQLYEKLGDQKNADLKYFQLAKEFSDLSEIKAFLTTRESDDFFNPGELLDAPWEDGELLEYNIYGMNGAHQAVVTRIKRRDKDLPNTWIGTIHNINLMNGGRTHVRTVSRDKKQEFVYLEQSNFGVAFASMEVKNDQYVFKNAALNVETAQSDIIDGFINTEIQDVLRRLPITEGFSVKVKGFAAGQPGWFEYRLVVDSLDELITIGNKVYSAAKLTGSIHANGQNIYSEEFWLENSPERTPLKVATPAFHGELVSKENYYEPAKIYELEHNRIHMRVPTGWRAYKTDVGNDESRRRTIMELDSQAAVLIGWGQEYEIDWNDINMAIKSDGSKQWAKGFYPDFEVIESTFTLDAVEGIPSVRYSGKYNGGMLNIIEDRTWLAVKPDWYNIAFSYSESVDQEIKDDIDSIIRSISLPSKNKQAKN